MDDPLTLQEFDMDERVPLADVFRAVFEVLVDRDDAVVFGAQAVNSYVGQPRMTHDIDVLSTNARSLSEDLRRVLNEKLRIAARVRAIDSRGFRIYQSRKPGPRHLVDVRQVERLPRMRRLRSGIAVVAPLDLIVMKLRSLAARGRQEKGLSDRLDLLRLLRRFPSFREERAYEVTRLLGDEQKAIHVWVEVLGEVPEEPTDW